MANKAELFFSLPDSETNSKKPLFEGWNVEEYFFLSSLESIDYVAESAWLGHTPFMFSLMKLLKPRRFVELGTHHGVSFFSACQIVQKEGLSTQCIAVDNWVGESQAGYHEEKVFKNFEKHLLSNYSGFASFIREDFNEAAKNFQDQSIDFLHIDGFHSYDSVKNDFETWLPKMFHRGVILFHDINEHQSSFGAWRFWREIEKKYQGKTFFLGHSHGLGLLTLDESDSSPIATLLKFLSLEKNYQFTEHFFTLMGDMQKDSYHLRANYNINVEKLDVLSRQVSDLLNLNNEMQEDLEIKKKEIDNIRSTFSWKVTKPLRTLRYLTRNKKHRTL